MGWHGMSGGLEAGGRVDLFYRAILLTWFIDLVYWSGLPVYFTDLVYRPGYFCEDMLGCFF